VLRGTDLEALADDPDDLAADLQALAGPSASPNGGAIFIDGFSGGQLPSKESIREIRINQNPFSPEYDKLGFGRIEIFTKPGSDKFKGLTYFNFADDFWNSRNPYAARKAPLLLKEYGGSLSGPLNKKGSFFLDVRRDSVDNGASINATTLDPATLAIVDPFTDVFRIPQRRVMVSPRLDYQLGANHTLTGRYQFMRADVRDSGIGSFNLISRGYHAQSVSQTAQITETAVMGASLVNETRFQFFRAEGSSIANDPGPAIQVLGSFNGGGATQLSINTGTPAISASQVDVGAFLSDDWRLRPNLSLSLGLRYETQTHIHDWRDLAPRIGLAWAPGAKSGKSRPKSVIRAGFGMFYDRFALANTLAALRYNGIVQQQYVVTDPDFFPAVPPVSALAGLESTQTMRAISATLRAPYVMQSALGFERQLPFNTTLAITYAHTHGLHMLRSQAAGPVFLMESSGLYNQNQVIANVNSRVNQRISLFGAYVYNHARSNTDGVNTFPANPYNFSGEYGPAATDIRHRASLGGTLETKWGLRLNPMLVADSGPPFDITAGSDLYGTTLFNARPGIVRTKYGLLDPHPTPDEFILPRNYGRGPGSVTLNLRLSKTFAFGSGEGHDAPSSIPGGGGQRRDNPGPIVGNITSPLFGQANQPAGSGNQGGTSFSEAANNRRLELQMRFTF
jgi:hypothetical protein